MNCSLRLFTAAALWAALLVLLALPTRAQYALPADVISGGGTDASAGTFALRGTLGQPVAGPTEGGSFSLGQGFWYAATPPPSSPALIVTATPLDPPVAVPAGGGSFRFRITVTNTTSTAQSFDGWIDVLLPNGTPYPILGPRVLTLGPNETFGPVTLRQQVPGLAPAGSYVHRIHAGTFPDTPIATDTFLWTKSSAALARGADTRTRFARSSPAATHLARTTPAAAQLTSQRGARAASPASTLTRAGRRSAQPSPWLLLMDATGEPVGGQRDLALAMPLDAAAEARISAEEAARDTLRARAGALTGADSSTTMVLHSPHAQALELPAATVLAPPSPNPFRARTTVRFGLPHAAAARLTVYDVHGRRVALLLDEERAPGWHEAVFDGTRLASGVYLVRLEAGRQVFTRRVTLVR